MPLMFAVMCWDHIFVNSCVGSDYSILFHRGLLFRTVPMFIQNTLFGFN